MSLNRRFPSRSGASSASSASRCLSATPATSDCLRPGTRSLPERTRRSPPAAELAAHDARAAGAERVALRIGADIDLPRPVVTRLRRFGTERPELELRLTVQQQDDLLVALDESRLDAAIVWTSPPADAATLEWALLTEVELHGVLRHDDALAHGEALSRTDTNGQRLVLYQPSRATRPFYDALLAELAGAQVAHVPVLDDAQEAMLATVVADGGLTITTALEPSWQEHADLVAMPFRPALVGQVALVWRRGAKPVSLEPLLAHFKAATIA